MAVDGAEQTHGGAQLAAELAELLSVPRKLLRRRACRAAEVVHLCPILHCIFFSRISDGLVILLRRPRMPRNHDTAIGIV